MALPTYIAQFPTACGLCDDRIEEGQTIAKLEDDDEWVHASCAMEEGHDVEDGDE